MEVGEEKMILSASVVVCSAIMPVVLIWRFGVPYYHWKRRENACSKARKEGPFGCTSGTSCRCMPWFVRLGAWLLWWWKSNPSLPITVYK